MKPRNDTSNNGKLIGVESALRRAGASLPQLSENLWVSPHRAEMSIAQDTQPVSRAVPVCREPLGLCPWFGLGPSNCIGIQLSKQSQDEIASTHCAKGGKARTRGIAQVVLGTNRRGVATASHRAAKPLGKGRVVLDQESCSKRKKLDFATQSKKVISRERRR